MPDYISEITPPPKRKSLRWLLGDMTTIHIDTGTPDYTVFYHVYDFTYTRDRSRKKITDDTFMVYRYSRWDGDFSNEEKVKGGRRYRAIKAALTEDPSIII